MLYLQNNIYLKSEEMEVVVIQYLIMKYKL